MTLEERAHAIAMDRDATYETALRHLREVREDCAAIARTVVDCCDCYTAKDIARYHDDFRVSEAILAQA